MTLSGTVKFSGNVTLAAPGTLTIADNGVIIADGTVNLTAPHVVLGIPFQPPLPPGTVTSPYSQHLSQPVQLRPVVRPGRSQRDC